MKKYILVCIFSIFISLGLSGCNSLSDGKTSFSVIYCITAVIAALLLIGCMFLVHKNKKWFVLLFSSVFVVNMGYTFLSVSNGLEMSLLANRMSYLGSVFLPLSMLMIILNITNTKCKKTVQICLFVLAIIMFLITASQGILPIYYKEVSFAVADGVSVLVKVYGPLHSLYLVYLLGYFSAMVAVTIRAAVKKTFNATSHAIIIVLAVIVNIGVWFIEQVSDFDFEFLSVSYIITELFLCGVHMIINENQRLRELIQQKDEELKTTGNSKHIDNIEKVSKDTMKYFVQ